MPLAHSDPISILIVEDREEDMKLIRLMLERSVFHQRYELDWAASFDEGLALMHGRKHDVGLFDYDLGTRNGLELLRDAISRGIEMPIIMLTGVESTMLDVKAMQLGAADYVSKLGLTGVQLERAIRYARRHYVIQAELRRTNQLLNSVLTSLPVIAGRIDGQGVVTEARGSGLEQVGLSGRRLMGLSALKCWPTYAAQIRSALAGGGGEFTCSVERDGQTRYFDNYVRFDVANGEGAIGFSVDVTARVLAENESRRHAHLLESVLQSLSVLAGRIDRSGLVVEAEGDGLSRYGLAPAALLGRPLWERFPQSRKAIVLALEGGSSSFALGSSRADDDWSVDFFVSFDVSQGEGATFMARDLTERRQLERQLLTVADEEQHRIGADLHDGLGQELTGLACLAVALRDRLRPVVPKESEQAELIARLASEATAKSRALAHGLSPVQLEVHGLVSALEDLVSQSERLHGIEGEFVLRGEAPEIDHFAAIHLYRISQEAIHNAVRHGRARRVKVALLSRPTRHRLIVLDDGEGFDCVDAPRGGAGHGLRLMNYRANMLGGSLTVWSVPGRGSRVYCEWSRPTSFPNENRKDSLSSSHCRVA